MVFDNLWSAQPSQYVELGFWNPCPSKSQKIYNVSRRHVVERFRRGWPCNFLRGLSWGVTVENAQNVRGVKILRHRTGLLLRKLPNYIMIEANARFFQKQTKNVSNKMWSWAQEEPISFFCYQECSLHVHTYKPIHRAEIWKKYIKFFYFLKQFHH